MLREKETESHEEIRVLHYGKRFRYSKKEIVDEREEQHRVFEKSEPYAILHIKLYKERKYKEKDPQYSLVEEGISSQIIICVKPTTLCASPRYESETKTLSTKIIVSGGSENNS